MSINSSADSQSKQLKAVEGVLKTLEAMFFSMPIPEEIYTKYNFLKETRYKSAGIQFNPVPKKTNIQSKLKQDIPLNIPTEFEDCFVTYTQAIQNLFESLMNYFGERIAYLSDKDQNKSVYGIF